MPTFRGRRRRSSLSSTLFDHPDDPHPHHRSSKDLLPHLPVSSLYATATTATTTTTTTTTTTASSTEDGYTTTGSEDFLATSPQSLRLDEHDSYLLDDDPDPFANYLSRALSSSSSHLDITHTHTHVHTPATAVAVAAVAAPTQPKPFLTLVPSSFTSRVRRRLSTTGPPTPDGSIRRHRLFSRPSLPSLVTLAQRVGTSSGPILLPMPMTNEHADPGYPIVLARFPVDPSKHPDCAVAASSSSPSSHRSAVGARAMRVDTTTSPFGHLPPVAWNNHNRLATVSLNAYSRLPFPDDPNPNLTRRPSPGTGTGTSAPHSQQYPQNHTPGSNADSSQHSYSNYSGGGGGGGGSGTGGGRGGGGGGDDRSDGDRSRRPRGHRDSAAPGYSSTDAHTTTTEEDESGTRRSRNRNGTSDDSDDMPLARRLPGALTAQKSLRRQVREDRDMQRQVRARAKSAPRAPIPPQLLQAQVPGGGSGGGSGSGSLSADELTKKLLRVQVQPSSSPSTSYEPPALANELHTPASAYAYNKHAFPATPSRAHWLEAMTNRRGSESSDRHYPHTSPLARPNNAAQLNTAMNMTAFPQFPPSPHQQHHQQHQQHQQHHHAPHNNLHRAMSSAAPQARPTRSNGPPHEMPEPRQRAETLVALSGRQRANTLSAPSSSRPTTTSALTAPPPLPAAVPTLPGRGFAHEGGATMQQQRVFVGDVHRFSIVEIGPATRARDVVAMVDEEGELPRETKAGGWMLFELSNDFGMERPIREFELVMEVYNSWNTATRLNTFMLKKTPLATTLAPQNIPKTPPKFGGYVEWEQKRGKWSKRWLELREHSLWVSKKEGAPAKDAMLICSLSNFDAYLVTRIHKAPKPFTFSVKSVDNLNLFERAADYHHVFSCSVGDGLIWLERILLARSYVLQQERAALFTNTQSPTPTLKSTGVSRAGTTKRGAPSNGPFLSFDLAPSLPPIAPLVTPPESTFFEPGSLLARRMAGEK